VKRTSISVTEAARNFADCVNRAYYQRTEFVLLRNGKPVARLTPEEEKVCTGLQLAEAAANPGLPTQEAREWNKERAAARKRPIAPKNKWQ
jgi:antitoxin (DNA-binding transcriptional repressor) of toxin-antitoxin stability system